MNPTNEFFNLYDLTQGVRRELSPGISTRIFAGVNAMLSIVRLDPNAEGRIHSHEEEQWGVLLEGNGVRIQAGEEVPVETGDFWRTPSGVPHGIRAGTTGALVLDIFSPPRAAYKKAGTGFGGE